MQWLLLILLLINLLGIVSLHRILIRPFDEGLNPAQVGGDRDQVGFQNRNSIGLFATASRPRGTRMACVVKRVPRGFSFTLSEASLWQPGT
jgi:hypothetical protein